MKTFSQLLTEVMSLAQTQAHHSTATLNDTATDVHSKLKQAGVRVHKKIAKARSLHDPVFIHVHKDDVKKAHSVLKSAYDHHKTDGSDHYYTSGPKNHKGKMSHKVFTPKTVGQHSDHQDHHIIGVSYNPTK